MRLQEAYKTVYEHLTNCGCDMLLGKYDAKNGSESFMYGIKSMMEIIAYQVSEQCGDEFSDKFLENMKLSEEKVDRQLALCYTIYRKRGKQNYE